MKIGGVVLAGGRSTRFGRDKASAILNGEPLIHWSVEALGARADILAVNGPQALCDLAALPRIFDAADSPVGPLAGVLGSLGWATVQGCSHLLTAPCDTPFLPRDMGIKLASAIDDAPVAAARAARAHPLCALWRTDVAPALATLAAETEQPSLQAIIGRLGGVWLDFPDEAAFANLNTPAEFEEAERRFAG